MQYGLSAGPLMGGLLYGLPIEKACEVNDFSPLVAYAIAMRETIRGEHDGSWDACTVVSSDNGCGLFQITPALAEGGGNDWWTPEQWADWKEIDWRDPVSNCVFALKYFLIPALDYWAGAVHLEGDALLKCIAVEYNAGRPAAIKAHVIGDVDSASTNHNYGADVVANYHRLENGEHPV